MCVINVCLKHFETMALPLHHPCSRSENAAPSQAIPTWSGPFVLRYDSTAISGYCCSCQDSCKCLDAPDVLHAVAVADIFGFQSVPRAFGVVNGCNDVVSNRRPNSAAWWQTAYFEIYHHATTALFWCHRSQNHPTATPCRCSVVTRPQLHAFLASFAQR